MNLLELIKPTSAFEYISDDTNLLISSLLPFLYFKTHNKTLLFARNYNFH